MKRSGVFAAVVTTGLLLSLAPGAGAEPQKPDTTANTPDTYNQLNLFGEVFEQVRANYVDKVTDDKLVEGAINGMLTSLDPHSNYLNAKDSNDMKVQTRG